MPDDFPISDAEISARAATERPLFGASPGEIAALHRWSAAARPLPADDPLPVFVLFIGYPRSGHSLIGSLLDAHSDVAIAHELDVLRFMADGFRRDQILSLIIENAARIARVGRRWGPYDYRVPGQWQGRIRHLRAIGDKKGGATTTRIAVDPTALDRLIALLAMPIRAIHCVRNPFDNVATIARRHYPDAIDPLAMAIQRYAGLVRANAAILRRLAAGALTIRHEEVVADPDRSLRRLAEHVGVEAHPEWLAAAAARITDAPRRSRAEIDWPTSHRDAVERLIAEFDFLAAYRVKH